MRIRSSRVCTDRFASSAHGRPGPQNLRFSGGQSQPLSLSFCDETIHSVIPVLIFMSRPNYFSDHIFAIFLDRPLLTLLCSISDLLPRSSENRPERLGPAGFHVVAVVLAAGSSTQLYCILSYPIYLPARCSTSFAIKRSTSPIVSS